MQILRMIFPLLAAGSLAVLLYFLLKGLLAWQWGARRALADFQQSGAGTDSPKDRSTQAQMGSKINKLRIAFDGYGLNVSGWEQNALILAYSAGAVVLLLPLVIFKLPVLIWLAAPVLSYFLVNSLVEGKWSKLRQQIEKEIPLLLTRLSGALQSSSNILAVLSEEAENLEPGGPLQAWLVKLVQRIQAQGASGLAAIQEEAKEISPALLLFAVQVERLYETGGQGYVEAFQMTADNLSGLLETRAEANAVADGAWGTVRIIALALGAALGSVLLNPASTAISQNPVVQAGMLFAILWAGVGFWYIGNTIREAVE
jgi:hypothetical protein